MWFCWVSLFYFSSRYSHFNLSILVSIILSTYYHLRSYFIIISNLYTHVKFRQPAAFPYSLWYRYYCVCVFIQIFCFMFNFIVLRIEFRFIYNGCCCCCGWLLGCVFDFRHVSRLRCWAEGFAYLKILIWILGWFTIDIYDDDTV